jgi:aminoglycoside phosphotransferase (APT) family kinase protein
MSGFPEDTSALDAWASAHVAGYRGPSRAKKFDTGQSNPTYLLETPERTYVLRRKPPGKLLKSAHMVEREYRVLRALEGVGFPSPRALALCEDESVAGSVFYLMAYVEGRIFWDPALPGMTREDRAAIFDAMNETLAKLHSVDVTSVGLADYGKPGNYFARQFQRWSEQYRASETSAIPDMDALMPWLAARIPADDGRVALVHGDWRIDNMIFDKKSTRLLAVLDWELSTLGHPFADIAYQCMQWRLPSSAGDGRVGDSRGLGGVDRAALGIPTEAEYVAAYCRRAGIGEIANWPFLLAFCFFRYAAIAQGVFKRSLDGNASNPARAAKIGAAVPMMARLAMEIVEKGA